jgi:hypothetical protein
MSPASSGGRRECRTRLRQLPRGLPQFGFERLDPSPALCELRFQASDRHVAPADLAHGASPGGEAALGLLLQRTLPNGQFGAEVIAIGGDLGERERKGRFRPAPRQPVGSAAQRRQRRQGEQAGAQEAEDDEHGGFDQGGAAPVPAISPGSGCHALIDKASHAGLSDQNGFQVASGVNFR